MNRVPSWTGRLRDWWRAVRGGGAGPPGATVPTEMSASQQEALLDLLVMGIYSSGRLSAGEDSRIQRLLDECGIGQGYRRQQLVDGAFTRAGRNARNPEAMRASLAALADRFPRAESRQAVARMIEGMFGSTQPSGTQEFLENMREVFEPVERSQSSSHRQ